MMPIGRREPSEASPLHQLPHDPANPAEADDLSDTNMGAQCSDPARVPASQGIVVQRLIS